MTRTNASSPILIRVKMWQGGKNALRIVYHHANVVFLCVAPQPPCHGLKDPKYAMDKRVKDGEGL